MPLEPFINEFVGIVSVVKKPIFVTSEGTRYFVSLVSSPENTDASLEEMKNDFAGEAYLYPVTGSDGELKLDLEKEEKITLASHLDLVESLKAVGYFPQDLVIRNVLMASAADKGGLQKGDILTHLEGKPLGNFEDLRSGLQAIDEGKAVELVVISAGNPVTKSITPEVKEVDGKKVKLMGIESAVEYVQPKLVVARAESVGAAITGAFTRTWDGVIKTFSGYKKLITREVSLNNIGGPLAIGKVASDSLNISMSMFFRLMAIISINLAVINLFPIPVLDGGHIMFLALEAINGGPLSRRKVEIAQRFGVSVLFFLIFVAIFNDISRLF